MGIGGFRRVVLAALTTAATVAGLTSEPAAAYPYTLTRIAAARVPLAGHGCGDTPQAVLELPTGARGYRAFPNEPSDKSIHDAADNVVADPVGATFVPAAVPYYLFTFNTSAFVCTHPDIYPAGEWVSHTTVGAYYHLTRYSTSRNPRYCGDALWGFYWVRAYRVSCATALRLANPKTEDLQEDLADDLAHGLGFTCRSYDVSRNQVRVACRRGASLVLFYVFRYDN